MIRFIASIDVDAQKGFTPLCPDELPVPGGDEIGPELNFMAGMADFRVGSKDAHSALAPWVVGSADEMLKPTGLPNADLTWKLHCVPGTKGYELLDGLPQETEYDYFVYKGVSPDLHPYGACFHDLEEKLSTGLIEWLTYKKVEIVIVGGLAFDFCVKTTAIQLANAGFEVLVYRPATRSINPVPMGAFQELSSHSKISVIDSQEALKKALGDQEAIKNNLQSIKV